MGRYSFIAHMPDEPGSLHRAAEIIKKYDGNINRIQFDRRIDPGTVFYEVTASEASYRQITGDLARIGYLQTSLKTLDFLKFCVYLPHRPGALYEFLGYITSAGANIALIDFDDRGRHPDRLTVSLNLEQSREIDRLLDQLKSRYRLEIIEYDTTGKHLDDTVFYVRYAQEVRELIGESEDAFLLSFLADTNHIVQELMDRGCNPRQVFDSVLATGRTMKATSGNNFYAAVQQFAITSGTTLYRFQPPCGGSVFLIRTPDELVMIDTGYGIYHPDILAMFSRYGAGDLRKLSRIIVTHADADHCGASGLFAVPVYLHRDTLEILRTNNRAYGSRSQESVLEEFYTKMINLFSRFAIPADTRCFPGRRSHARDLSRHRDRQGWRAGTGRAGRARGAYLRAGLPVFPGAWPAVCRRQHHQFCEPDQGAGRLQFACCVPRHFGECRQRAGETGAYRTDGPCRRNGPCACIFRQALPYLRGARGGLSAGEREARAVWRDRTVRSQERVISF